MIQTLDTNQKVSTELGQPSQRIPTQTQRKDVLTDNMRFIYYHNYLKTGYHENTSKLELTSSPKFSLHNASALYGEHSLDIFKDTHSSQPSSSCSPAGRCSTSARCTPA